MQIFNFFHTDFPIFLKINRVKVIDEIDKLYKFLKKSNQKCKLYHVNKKKTNRQTDGRTDRRMDDGNHAMT